MPFSSRLLSFVAVLAAILTCHTQGQDLPTQVLEEMNLARTQPQRYAQLLSTKMSGPRADSRDVAEAIRFLQRAKPLSPLSYSAGMTQSARLHVSDMGPRGGRGHSGSNGSTPFTRMNQFGQWVRSAGENIYYGTQDARGILCTLIVDSGVSNRQHRKNIFNPAFTVTGIAHGRHAGFGAMCVMDFASGYVERDVNIAGL